MIARGDVVWADFGDPIGSQPGFRRPVVVVQGDAFNLSAISTVVCVPITSNLALAKFPGNVSLPSSATGLARESVANVSQVTTLDRTQLGERVGRLSKSRVNDLLAGLDLVLGR